MKLMQEISFTIDIQAPKEHVWSALWDDTYFREWAGIIDPGTYMVGELREGNEVQSISAENGYGVTSVVEKLIINEFTQLRHVSDTQDVGAETRKDEWTGGVEKYKLTDDNHSTLLEISFSVPKKLEDYFNNAYPKVMEKIKELSESIIVNQLKVLCDDLHGFTASIMIPNYSKNVLESRYYHNLHKEWASLTNHLDESTDNGTAFTTGKPVIKNNLGLKTLRQSKHQHPIEAVIVVPIIRGKKSVATLVVLADDPTVQFSNSDVVSLQKFIDKHLSWV